MYLTLQIICNTDNLNAVKYSKVNWMKDSIGIGRHWIFSYLMALIVVAVQLTYGNIYVVFKRTSIFIILNCIVHRYMFGLSIIPAIVQGIGMIFLPKSPRWLLIKNRQSLARKNLALLREGEVNIDAELDQIQITINQQVNLLIYCYFFIFYFNFTPVLFFSFSLITAILTYIHPRS